MNGSVTYRDLEEWKRKAAAFDEVLAYLRKTEGVVLFQILQKAISDKTEGGAGRKGRERRPYDF